MPPGGIFSATPFCFPRGRVFCSRPLFSASGARFYPDPPPFFACRPARFQHASREPRIPQGVYLSAVGGIFHAIITAFSRISAHFQGISRRAPSGAAGG